MKTRITNLRIGIPIIAALLILGITSLLADDAPTYRGKVVLVVDKTIASDPDVSWRIERLINDLTGDGWRVLRHDVDRGPELYNPYTLSGATALDWAQRNAPRVREVRALIQADYNAAPTEVKNVFLIGHVPVPYSGTEAIIVGGHYEGADPADAFYGDVTSPYEIGGWTDIQTDLDAATTAPWLPQVQNRPADGKFDQNLMPSPMKLGVGRVDFYGIFDMGVNETTMISRYLDKDHDFRNASFLVQRKAILAGLGDGSDGGFCIDSTPFEDAFGSGNVASICENAALWFPNVGLTNYMLGYGGGWGGGNGAAGIGTTEDNPGDSANNFRTYDSQVVFVNLYGSFFGNWEESEDFLRAPLANPYDPVNGRFGYGLTAVWGKTLGLDEASLQKRVMGGTIGEALFSGYTNNVNYGLMGDPTLRMHSVQEPTALTASKTGTSVTLNWTASPDTAVTNYNIYRAPTRRGPYVIVNTAGPVAVTTFTATRPGPSDPPDNFYMVRAIKTETTPFGNYINMGEGLIISLPGTLTPYLNIVSQPANQAVAVHSPEGIATASAVFTVDAIGSDITGNTQVRYQWFKGSSALYDDCNIQGATASSLLIRGVQVSDAGDYHVVVSNYKPFDGITGIASITSSTASLMVDLTLNTPPTISSIGSQQMAEDGTLDVPFTVNDDFTPLDSLVCTVISSDQVLLPNSHLTITGTGNNRVLHINIAGLHRFGSGTVTVTVTDDYTASTSVSFQTTVNVANTITMRAEPFSGNNFQFEATGPANSSVQLWTSDDLITWTPAGSFSLTGNIYNFVDTTVGSALHRFYRAEASSGCSANIIGFIKVTVPTTGYLALANQLNTTDPAGNILDVLFPNFPDLSKILTWDASLQGFATYTQNGSGWKDSSPLNPGQGIEISAGGTTAVPVTLMGDVPLGQPANSFTDVAGGFYLIGSILPRAGSLSDLSFPATEGDKIWQFQGQQWVVTGTYTGGNWTPSVPSVQVGESFFLQSGTSGSRTWTQNLPLCAPSVTLSSPTDGSTFVGPASISLSAVATADAGISKVEFFQGATSLGVGTQSGNTYSINWNNPGTGTYSITAHATDNDGITTISLPVSITVDAQPSLGSEAMSGSDFQFTINGSAGASVVVQSSQDLATWTSLATVTLSGGSYTYTDTGVGTSSYRFYRVQQSGNCSANVIGFINLTAPISGNLAFANQLNNPGGNTANVLFPSFPSLSQLLIWDSSTQLFATYNKHSTWSGNPVLSPGQGAEIHAGGTTDVPMTLLGEVPMGQQVNNFTAVTGQYNLLSSIVPRAGNLNDLGFPAAQGDQILQYQNQQWVTTGTYTGGSWTPSVPTVTVGECFYLLSGTSGSRTWTENGPACP